MFTGLITDIGRVVALNKRDDYLVMQIKTSYPKSEIAIGDSVACNGVCLTVISQSAISFDVEISPESIDKSTLKKMSSGSKINLELALAVGSRLGGHFVTGHVDTRGIVDYLKEVGRSLELAIKYDSEFDKIIIEKGSIAINGVSLTINQIASGWLSVNLIPHTASQTTLVDLTKGTEVNLEFDMIGKYIAKMNIPERSSSLTGATLRKSGW